MEVSGRRGTSDDKHANRRSFMDCEACNGDGVTTKADGVCVKCNEFMCKKCFKDHLKAKQCRNHVFDTTFPKNVPLKREFEVEKCKRHVGEQIKFFCRKHETIGCGECMIPDHAVCSPENIKDLCKEFRFSLDFAGLERTIKDVECSAEANSMKIKENRNANAEMYKTTLNGIKQFREDINTYLDNAERTLLKEAKEVLDANNKHLTKQENNCMKQSSRIAAVRGQLDPDLYSESGLFIQTVTFKSIIQDLQLCVSRIQQESKMKEFNFVPDEQLHSLTKSLQSFGNICCSTQPSTVSKEETTILPEITPNTLAEDRAILAAADAFNENRDCCFDTKIVVGSRVTDTRKNLNWRGKGTVTNVGSNGRVTVKLDWSETEEEFNIEDFKLI